MANLAHQVEQERMALKTLREARNTRPVRINPLVVTRESQVPGPVDEDANRAMLAASIMGHPRTIANAMGSGSYSSGYYGTFQTDSTPSYEDILGITPVPEETTPADDPTPAAPAQTEQHVDGGNSASVFGTVQNLLVDPNTNTGVVDPTEGAPAQQSLWAKYKTYIIIALVLVGAFIAYKKL